MTIGEQFILASNATDRVVQKYLALPYNCVIYPQIVRNEIAVAMHSVHLHPNADSLDYFVQYFGDKLRELRNAKT